jgi:hypothetical protein
MKPFHYEKAPAGSEDKFRLTRDVTFTWKDCPKWVYEALCLRPLPVFTCEEGMIFPTESSLLYQINLKVFKGFCFSVSVAPDFDSTMAGSCQHDFMYKHVDAIAAFYGIPVRTVLHIADHWFLANLRAADFLCARTYFLAVRTLGYSFNRMFKKDTK